MKRRGKTLRLAAMAMAEKEVKSIRAALSQAAEMHRKRFEEFEVEEKRWRHLLSNQATIHAREIVEFTVSLKEKHDALRQALSLVNVARRNEWTVACEAELKQIQETDGAS